jgi:two-component system, NtrC family, sensor histidine kinase PilS
LPVLSSSTPVFPAEEFRRRLMWLTVFRLVVTTLLLVMLAVRVSGQPAERGLSREDSLSFGLVAFVYLLTLVYGLVLRNERVGAWAGYLQLCGDVLIASGLVYLTGGPDSPFAFTYSLSVVAGSVVLLQRGALVVAALGSGAYALLLGSLYLGWLSLPEQTSPLNHGRGALLLLSNTLAQFLLAVLSGYLARQLSATGGRLSAREADLRSLALLQRQILECMPSGLLTCNEEHRVTFINHAAEAILELPAGSVRGEPVDAVLPGALRLGTTARRRELAVNTRSGQRILGLTVTPMAGSSGALLIVFQDLTELRQMEDALRRADQLAALGKLSAQLAHEIRNPLAAMRGSAQLLAQESGEDQATRRLTAILLREADRLSQLVDDFLRFARPSTPQLRVCSLGELVRETVEMMRADPLSRGVRVDVRLAEVVAQVDPDQLRQVLLNLLRNALQAAGPQGAVRVDVAAVEEGPLIRVWDSAGSIPLGEQSRIFEPFFTTRQGGTGLGLSTAQSIIRAHGGIIRVSSNPMQGTEFVVTLPALLSEGSSRERSRG